jgi:hypothetical protein
VATEAPPSLTRNKPVNFSGAHFVHRGRG